MQIDEFLRTVITTPSGYFCLAHRRQGEWQEQFFQWPGDLDKIIGEANTLREHGDVYFSAHLFKEPRSLKANVLPTRTIQADLDYADSATLSVLPTILTETSPDRHQGFWIAQTMLDVASLEALSRRIAYGVPDCDRTGWPAGKKLRLPHTYNYKYDKPHMVDVVGVSLRDLTIEVFNNFPELKVPKEQAETDIDWVDNEQAALNVDHIDLLTELKPLIPSKVYSQYTKPAKDRSAALWAFTVEILRAGCSREQAFWLAKGNANNKFADRPDSDRDLRKDILRAEHYVSNRQADIKAIIMDLRYKGNKHLAERMQLITQVIMNYLREQGEFVHARGGGIYYLRRDTGRPMYITLHGEWLASYLDITFGLNASETVTRFVINALSAYCKTLPQSVDLQVLSYFDKFSRKLLVHTGGRDVLHVGADSIEVHPNGYGGVVFQWNGNLETITLDKAPLDAPWHEFMYAGQLDNLINLTREEGLATLRAWTMFLLFRRMATSRPILTLVGQPGCLSGDTKIHVRRGEHSAREYTLRDMYKRLHDTSYHGWAGTRSEGLETRVLSCKDGVIARRPIRTVHYSGRKMTYTVTVGNRAPFRATADHRFLTPTCYRRLESLRVGDKVVVAGDNLESVGRNTAIRTVVTARHHPHARMKLVMQDGNVYGPYMSILRARAAYESVLNGISLEAYLLAVNDAECAATLQYASADTHFHHKDRNPANDASDNIEAMSKAEHDKLHGPDNVRNLGAYSGQFDTAVDTITSIVPYGEEDTYDIEMVDSEAPNFVVNGVVVHNSGKTTMAKKVYRLVYGPYKAIGDLSSQDDFDLSTSNLPLVAYDNLDTWVAWLPNRLAAGTGDTDIERRKLFTDSDIITRKRQALLLLTAHNPRFTREDVVDRMVMLSFSRYDKHGNENAILDSVTNNRGRIWAAIIQDVQQTLATPMPELGDCPQFRIEDFSYLGVWFSRAHSPDMEADFRRAITKLAGNQRSFTLEQDQMLVDALTKMVAKHPEDDYINVDLIHTRLSMYVKDANTFRTAFKLPMHIGRKLWVMQNSLKELFDIEWKYADNGVGKVWRIAAKAT